MSGFSAGKGVRGFLRRWDTQKWFQGLHTNTTYWGNFALSRDKADAFPCTYLRRGRIQANPWPVPTIGCGGFRICNHSFPLICTDIKGFLCVCMRTQRGFNLKKVLSNGWALEFKLLLAAPPCHCRTQTHTHTRASSNKKLVLSYIRFRIFCWALLLHIWAVYILSL